MKGLGWLIEMITTMSSDEKASRLLRRRDLQIGHTTMHSTSRRAAVGGTRGVRLATKRRNSGRMILEDGGK